jgi:hypothetical protein
MAEKTVAAQQKMGFGLFEKAAEDAAALQAKWVEQSFKSFDEYNALVKAGFKYWADLGAEARKLSLDTMP